VRGESAPKAVNEHNKPVVLKSTSTCVVGSRKSSRVGILVSYFSICASGKWRSFANCFALQGKRLRAPRIATLSQIPVLRLKVCTAVAGCPQGVEIRSRGTKAYTFETVWRGRGKLPGDAGCAQSLSCRLLASLRCWAIADPASFRRFGAKR